MTKHGGDILMRPRHLLGGLIIIVATISSEAHAIEYRLQVANLYTGAFFSYMNGPVGMGEGELTMPDLERALDQGTVSRGVLIYDRDIVPADPVVARAWGAAAVRPISSPAARATGEWTTVRWEGMPGQRVVWIVMLRTAMHRNLVTDLALAGVRGGLRYFIPYDVGIWPTPRDAVTYHIQFLRTGEDGVALWDRHLHRAVSLADGIAAVVGTYPAGTDWVYLVVAQPPMPTTFKVVIASPPHNRYTQPGGGGGGGGGHN